MAGTQHYSPALMFHLENAAVKYGPAPVMQISTKSTTVFGGTCDLCILWMDGVI